MASSKAVGPPRAAGIVVDCEWLKEDSRPFDTKRWSREPRAAVRFFRSSRVNPKGQMLFSRIQVLASVAMVIVLAKRGSGSSAYLECNPAAQIAGKVKELTGLPIPDTDDESNIGPVARALAAALDLFEKDPEHEAISAGIEASLSGVAATLREYADAGLKTVMTKLQRT